MSQQTINRRTTLTSSEADHYAKETKSHAEEVEVSSQSTGERDELTAYYTRYPNRWSRVR